ncbi:MAG TPA: hypothetical protein VFB72_20695 [Verrucomicrobiae bacterium]|nr:hypothetical protein [Verrucomicrobiae bacterium]
MLRENLFKTVAKSSYGDFGVRWHDTAFLPGDMSPGSKARTCPRTPNKNFQLQFQFYNGQSMCSTEQNYKTMKRDTKFSELRAGVISLLVLAIGYLYLTRLAYRFHMWAIIVLGAVCIFLMMHSIVDLFVWLFAVAASFSGKGLGTIIRLARRL